MSRVFSFKKSILNDKVDETIQLNNPLIFNPNKSHYVKIIEAVISSHIQNINSFYNNNKIRVTIGVSTIYDIVLKNGSYSFKDIQNAIENVLIQNTLIRIDPDSSNYLHPILIDGNEVLQRLYITIDNTALVTPEVITIDFSISNISKVMGFNSIISGNGLHEGDSISQMDFFGNSARIILDIGSDLVVINEKSTKEICAIQLNTTTTDNFYSLFKNVSYTPKIQFSSINQLTNYKIKILGKNDMFLYFTDGDISISFSIIEI